MHTTKGLKGLLYIRVSTDKQLSNNSIPVQTRIGQEYFKRERIQLVRTFADDISGKNFKRPAFEDMKAYCKTNASSIDIIVVIDWSRFGRNALDSLDEIKQFRQLGISVQAIEQPVDHANPESLITQLIYLGLPQVENERRAINVIKGMKASLTKGVWCGGQIPLGYRRDKNTGEYLFTSDADIIKKAFGMIREGATITEIQAKAASLGLKRPLKTWSKTLRNVYYIGHIRHKLLGEQEVQGRQPALVDTATFYEVQRILDGHKKGMQSQLGHEDFPLKGTLHCHRCEQLLTGYHVKKKKLKSGRYLDKKTIHPYYKCNTTHCKVNLSARKMNDSFATDVLSEFVPAPGISNVLRVTLRDHFKKMTASYQHEIRTYSKEKVTLSERMSKLDYLYIDGKLDESTYHQRKREMTEQLVEVESRIIQISDDKLSNPSRYIDFGLHLAENLPDTWRKAGLRGRQTIQRAIFPEGLSYDKENDLYRTPAITPFYAFISSLGHKIQKHQAKNPVLLTSGSP